MDWVSISNISFNKTLYGYSVIPWCLSSLWFVETTYSSLAACFSFLFYSILVEHPTILSFFASLTTTTNLLPLTLSRPSPPSQLSFEEAPVTHNPSSSLPYFLTWEKRIQFVHELISVDELFWKPKICKQLGRKIYIWTYLCCTLAKRTLSTEKLHSVARWSSYKWPSLILFPWNRF